MRECKGVVCVREVVCEKEWMSCRTQIFCLPVCLSLCLSVGVCMCLLQSLYIYAWLSVRLGCGLSNFGFRFARVYKCLGLPARVCPSWLIHMCDMTHSHVWYDSLIYVIWLTHRRCKTHSNVWHDSFVRVTWLIHMCGTWHTHRRWAKTHMGWLG